jgi:hypothetical protein
MKRDQKHGAAQGFTVSCMSGSGIPAGMVQYTVCRIVGTGARQRFVKVDRYGEIMTREEAERHNRERGYSRPWGRNTGSFHGFVQSRAARKRGYKPTGVAGRWYERAQHYHMSK